MRIDFQQPNRSLELEAGAIASLGWGYVGFAFLSHALRLPPISTCPFHLLTGHPCPLCGMTRAFGALLAGNVVEAIRLYPPVVPAFVGWLAMSTTASIVAVSSNIRRLTP